MAYYAIILTVRVEINALCIYIPNKQGGAVDVKQV